MTNRSCGVAQGSSRRVYTHGMRNDGAGMRAVEPQRSVEGWDATEYIRRLSPSALSAQLTSWDQTTFDRITATDLTQEQANRIAEPTRTFPDVRFVFAVHWHPEHVPCHLIRQRIDRLYPNKCGELIIPTQHNELLEWDGLVGAEVDCYAAEFKRKVQLLFHFRAEAMTRASQFRSMLSHTFRYRCSQLYEYLDSIIEERMEDRLLVAARKTSASQELIRFVRAYATRLRRLVRDNQTTMAPIMLKNKLVRFYFDALREHLDDRLIDQAQEFLRRVKKVVKARFDPTYFFLVQEVIEEARLHDPVIIVPHPEQFWPILMADYDLDGYEVWNPQSRDYTEFLIGAIHRMNVHRSPSDRKVLATMGDDCHMGEKLKPKQQQDPDKASREIGLQPAWDELPIRKSLVLGGIEKESLLAEYRERLS